MAMDKDLQQFLKKISSHTGIRIEATPYSEYPKIALLKHGDVFFDQTDKTTGFVFYVHGEKFVGVIDGADKTSRNYAYLIQGLIENAGSADISLGLKEYLKKIVTGDCSKIQVQKFLNKFNVPDVPSYAIVLKAGANRTADVMNVLDSYLSNALDTAIDFGSGNVVLVKFIDSPSDMEYQSAGEFAEYLSRSLYEELGVSVQMGVGTAVRNLQEITLSYGQALAALKMSEIFNSKGSVHNYKEYVLIRMLEEIPGAKLREYYNILCGDDSGEIFSDPDMLNTAEEFLNNSLNVSETSRKLFMHRNTLMYRLDKIEKATGLNIRNFSDAVTFRVIIILGKLLG